MDTSLGTGRFLTREPFGYQLRNRLDTNKGTGRDSVWEPDGFQRGGRKGFSGGAGKGFCYYCNNFKIILFP
jgi:hypothetical protein